MSAISTGTRELLLNEFNGGIEFVLYFFKDRVEPRMLA
jgi:hypothetical protein